MFHIKICGITEVEDAVAAVEAGADAIGLNFYARSPRHVDPARARRIAAAVPPEVARVGVFVNASADEIREVADQAGLTLVQLHGNEPPEVIRQLGGRPVMRAFRVGETGLGPVEAYLDACRKAGCLPRLVLLDALAPGQYGGTGRTADWTAAARYVATHDHPRLVLAGGLSAENVAAAILAVRPAAVDTASGVESRPGKKDPQKVDAFVRAARAAFRLLDQTA